MIKGKNRRQVLLNLTDNEVERLAKRLNCSTLLVVIESKLYNRTIGYGLRQFKAEVARLIREGGE